MPRDAGRRARDDSETWVGGCGISLIAGRRNRRPLRALSPTRTPLSTLSALCIRGKTGSGGRRRARHCIQRPDLGAMVEVETPQLGRFQRAYRGVYGRVDARLDARLALEAQLVVEQAAFGD